MKGNCIACGKLVDETQSINGLCMSCYDSKVIDESVKEKEEAFKNLIRVIDDKCWKAMHKEEDFVFGWWGFNMYLKTINGGTAINIRRMSEPYDLVGTLYYNPTMKQLGKVLSGMYNDNVELYKEDE